MGWGVDSVLCFFKAGDRSGAGGTRAEGAAGPARPSPLTVCRGQMYVRSLLIRTRKKIKLKKKKKKAIEASQRAQRTSKATLNPKFSHGSTHENKQGLDASVSKSLFTLR